MWNFDVRQSTSSLGNDVDGSPGRPAQFGGERVQRVEAGIDPAQDVFAEIRSEDFPNDAAALVGRDDGHPREDGLGLIVDVTADGAGVGLGAQQDGAGEERGHGSRRRKKLVEPSLGRL